MRNLKRLLETTRDRLSRLTEQEVTLNAELAVVQQEKEQIKGALDRIELIRSGRHELDPYDCMYCFVLFGSTSKMKPLSSKSEYVLLHCSGCGREFEIKP